MNGLRMYIQRYLQHIERKKGFTLIEMVAVLAILGVLLVTLLPNIKLATERARKTKIDADLNAINSASKLYELEQGKKAASIKVLHEAKFLPRNNYPEIIYNSGTGVASEAGGSGKNSGVTP